MLITRRSSLSKLNDPLEKIKQEYIISGYCPVDASHKLYQQHDNYYECRKCNKRYSYLAGTIFEGGRIDFHDRLDILWQLAQGSVTNKQAQREWGVGPDTYQRYQYKIFGACQDWMQEQTLAGDLEVDEAFLGKGVGRSVLPALFIAVEKATCGKAIIQVSGSFTKKNCHEFINRIDNDKVTSIHTDGWKGYTDIDKREIHMSYKELPQVHSAINHMKTYLKNYVRPVNEVYLPLYLSHWAWLYSHRHLKPEQRFHLLLDQGMKGRVLK